MSDIISARCFGCGNIIKVPAGLGGKKARCPQCTNTITIPMPNDTQMDEIVPDTELPEVARDGAPLELEEGDAPTTPAEEPREDHSDSRRRNSGTGVRRAVSAQIPSSRTPARGGTQTRKGGPGGAPANNSGMMIGIGLGVVALIILGVVLANKSEKHGGGSGKEPVKEKIKEKGEAHNKQPQVQYSEADQALVSRLMDYTSAVNRADPAQIQRFFAYEPDDERKVRIRIAQELIDKKVTYENVKVTSVSSASGTISFSYGAGSKTLQWKQVNDAWLIAELPSP